MANKFFRFLLAFSLLISAAVSGCARQVSAQEIANRTAEAIPKVDSVKMDMHATVEMSSAGGKTPFAMSMTQDMTAEINNTPRQMHAIINAAMNMAPLGNINMTMEMYLVDQWMYTATDLFGTGKQWIKTPVTETDWETQNQLQQQAEFLRSAVKVTSLGTEVVGGVECYVLEVKPDLAALMEWAKTQQVSPGAGMDGFDIDKVDLADMIKTYSMKEWITKDGYLLKKVEMEMVMEVSGQDFMATATIAGKTTMTLKASMNFYDYNKPVTISVPPEALAAQESRYPGIN